MSRYRTRLLPALGCILLAGLSAPAARAAQPMLMFSTQDAHGFYMVTFGYGQVAIRGRIDKQPVDRIEDYPAEKAQQLWNDIDRLAKDGLDGPVDEQHAHPELNYVILLQSSDGTRRSLSFPKCARNPRVDEVMQRLGAGLLPQGSPGLYPGKCPDPDIG